MPSHLTIAAQEIADVHHIPIGRGDSMSGMAKRRVTTIIGFTTGARAA